MLGWIILIIGIALLGSQVAIWTGVILIVIGLILAWVDFDANETLDKRNDEPHN